MSDAVDNHQGYSHRKSVRSIADEHGTGQFRRGKRT
jgi:hypothetical protein